MRSAIGPIWEKLKKIVRMMQLSWIKQWKGSLIRHGHVSPSSQNQNSIVWQVDNSLPCHNREKIFGHDLSKSHLLQFIQLYHIFQRKVTTLKMNSNLKVFKMFKISFKVHHKGENRDPKMTRNSESYRFLPSKVTTRKITLRFKQHVSNENKFNVENPTSGSILIQDPFPHVVEVME